MGYDMAIVGAGPAGYVCAIRAAQLGRKVALIEKEELGGLCLNWGCIPSKALLHNADALNLIKGSGELGFELGEVRTDWGKAIDRSRQVVKRLVSGVAFLMKKNGVEVIKAEAHFTGPHALQLSDGGVIEAPVIVIATGGLPRRLRGIEVDGERILTSREALAQRDLPARWLILGGGAVGVEFAYIYHSYGCEVTVVEMLDSLLPGEDEEVSAELRKAYQRSGIHCHTATRITGVERTADGLVATAAGPKGEMKIEADRLLMAAGYVPYTEGLQLEAAGLELTDQGFIPVNDRLETRTPGVYAIGDVVGPPMLAHSAHERGVIAAEAAAGLTPHRFVAANIPRAVYCGPQIASVGLTEREAREQGYEVKVGRFPYRVNGRALALAETTGFTKVVVDAKLDQVLGIHIVGADASELLGEATLAVVLEEQAETIGAISHAHPTLSETIKEAALAAEGRAIHI